MLGKEQVDSLIVQIDTETVPFSVVTAILLFEFCFYWLENN